MKQLSHLEKERIADGLNTYFQNLRVEYKAKNETFSQNSLANTVGISKGQVGYILKKQFDAKNNNGNDIITDRLLLKVQRNIGMNKQIWELENFDLCTTTFMECKLNGEHRIIDGSTGTGKSFAARQFSLSYPNNTHLIKMTSDHNAKQFLIDLGKETSIPQKYLTGTQSQVRKNLGDYFLDQFKPLVIIDEAEIIVEYNKHKILAAIKDLYDHKDLFENLGLTIMGANDFTQSMHNRLEMKRKYTYPQSISRLGMSTTYLSEYSYKEGYEICRSTYALNTTVSKEIAQKATDFRQLNYAIIRHLSDEKLLEAA